MLHGVDLCDVCYPLYHRAVAVYFIDKVCKILPSHLPPFLLPLSPFFPYLPSLTSPSSPHLLTSSPSPPLPHLPSLTFPPSPSLPHSLTSSLPSLRSEQAMRRMLMRVQTLSAAALYEWNTSVSIPLPWSPLPSSFLSLLPCLYTLANALI